MRPSGAPCGRCSSSSFERSLVDARLGVDECGAWGGRAGGRLRSRRRAPRRGSPASTVASAVRKRVAPADPIASSSPSASKARVGAMRLSRWSPGARLAVGDVGLAEQVVELESKPGSHTPAPTPSECVSTQARPCAVDRDHVRRVLAALLARLERIDERKHALGRVASRSSGRRGRSSGTPESPPRVATRRPRSTGRARAPARARGSRRDRRGEARRRRLGGAPRRA